MSRLKHFQFISHTNTGFKPLLCIFFITMWIFLITTPSWIILNVWCYLRGRKFIFECPNFNKYHLQLVSLWWKITFTLNLGVYWIQQIKLKSVWQPYVNFTATAIVQSKIITTSQSPPSDRRQRMQHAAFPFCSFLVGDLITLFELSHPRSMQRPQPDNHSLINHSRSGVNLIFNRAPGVTNCASMHGGEPLAGDEDSLPLQTHASPLAPFPS